MGSRTTSEISKHYKQIPKTNSSSILDNDVRNEIVHNHNQYKENSFDQFENSLGVFGKNLAINGGIAALLHLTPIVGDIYRGYKIGKIGYCYYLKVNESYKENGGDLNAALYTGFKQEVFELVPSFTKGYLVQTLIDSSWDGYKAENNVNIKNPAFENIIKSALSDTITEVI